MEIERKFTIKHLPENLEQYEHKAIEQGYLNTKPVVRIRKSNEEYYLTYKSKAGIIPSEVIVNHEIEVPLDKKSYEHLKEKVDDHIIEKTRYIIPIEDGLKVEFDIFGGNLKGLMFAEIEFPDEQKAKEFALLDWFDQDVSNVEKYKNSILSKMNSFDEFLKA